MSELLKITVEGVEYSYEKGTILEKIAMDIYPDAKERMALCNYNGKLSELSMDLYAPGNIDFIDISDVNGMRTYKRSAIFLLQKALDVVYSGRSHELWVKYSLGSGYFCLLENGEDVSEEKLKEIEEVMRDLVNKDLPIKKTSMHTNDARTLFKKMGMENKELLLKYRANSNTNVYDLDGAKDYFYGYMVPSTGYLTRFSLHKLDDGFVLQFPRHKAIDKVAPFDPPKRLHGVLKDSKTWAKTLKIPTVGALNDLIARGGTRSLILIQEALMEEEFAKCAGAIAERKGVKFVMIAGPSSSGKTTFSHRLSVQLRAKGLTPHPVPLDDYYLNRDQMPIDEFGEKDFEALEGLDIERFNNDMQSLLSGKETELPLFDFTTGKRRSKGRMLKLEKDDVLVIEGIHGLNDKLSYSLPVESKFKIYLSALTMLQIDEHNPLSTTDGRILRRIVRDARTRGTSAKETLAMFPSVKRGEEKNIFPFQESADFIFNSALIYELAVMKLYAEPQLYAIERGEPEYAEAKRLIKLLSYVLPMPTEDIPNNSLIREFIGGSCFGA